MKIRLKSRTQFPIGGFMASDPGGWRSTPWMDFNTICRERQAYRRANPRFGLSTDITVIEEQTDLENAQRMLTVNGGENYIYREGGPTSGSPKAAPPLKARLGNAAGAVKRVASGLKLLKEWWGEGMNPVDSSVANERSNVCLECPLNAQGDWTRFFTVPASEEIRHQLSIKNNMRLETPADAKLGVCEACSCPLKLKVWTPIDHIVKFMSPEVKSRLNEKCWILKEMQ